MICFRLSALFFAILLFSFSAFNQTRPRDLSDKEKERILQEIDSLNRKIASKPDDLDLYIWRARQFQFLGDTAAVQTDITTVLSSIDNAVSLAPDNPALYLQRASIYIDLASYLNYPQNTEKILSDTKKAIALKPDDKKFLSHSISKFNYCGQYEESLKIADKLVEIDPSNYAYYLSRFWIREKLKDFNGAVEDGIKFAETIPLKNIILSGWVYRILDQEIKNPTVALNYYERLSNIYFRRLDTAYNSSPQSSGRFSSPSNNLSPEQWHGAIYAIYRYLVHSLYKQVELHKENGKVFDTDSIFEKIFQHSPDFRKIKFESADEAQWFLEISVNYHKQRGEHDKALEVYTYLKKISQKPSP